MAPDYGYFNKKPTFQTDVDRVISYLDLNTSQVQEIISLDEIKSISFTEDMKQALHYFNHIMIAPDGKKFVFLHRYLRTDNKRIDRLFVADSDGQNLKLLSRSHMVSHYCWSDNNTLVCYMDDPLSGNAYYLINTNTQKISLIGDNSISQFGDGHPNFGKSKMTFDSYPDVSRMKKLMLYDFRRGNYEILGEFYESLKYYGPTRCDLHPRIVDDGNKVFFDSVHEGRRCLYLMEVK